MKTSNNRQALLFVFIAIFFFSLPGLNAQECTVLIPQTNKTGNVHPAKNAVITYRPRGRSISAPMVDKTIVKVKKTGGMARGEVKIYANNQLKYTVNFANGNSPTAWISRTLQGVSPNQVKVTINNKSAGFNLKYAINFSKVYSNLLRGEYYDMEIAPNMGEEQMITASTSCTRKIELRVSKQRGTYGRGVAYIYDGRNTNGRLLRTYNIPEQRGVAQRINVTAPTGYVTVKVRNTHPSTPLKVRITAKVD